MLNLIGNIIQIILFLLTWKANVSLENKEEKKSLAKEASDAIASGRVSRINAVVAKLHK